MDEEALEYKFKVALVGDSGVGKHTLIDKASMEVLENKLVENMGVKISLYNVQARAEDRAVYASVSIWGITATLKDGAFRKRIEENVQGLIVMADASRIDTIEHVPDWISKRGAGPDDLVMILVLNKVDLLEEDELLFAGERMRSIAERHKVQLILTSCETGLNLKKPFRVIARRLLKKQLG